ncbi:Uma2 family endonuclease [Phormidesmis sp. 146-12]
MTQLLDKTHDTVMTFPGTWESFKLIQQGLTDSPGIKLTYYKGTIELLMPGQDHEFFKSLIGYLIETFFYEKGINFKPTGSMTQEKETEASAQADESYCIGELKPIADLSIEVVFTSGGESKLARYRILGVSEVWFWQDGLFTLHHLREDGYEQIYCSELPGLETLNIDLLTRCVLIAQTDNGEAVRVFRQSI